MHKTHMIAYSDLQQTLRFVPKREIPVQTIAYKEMNFMIELLIRPVWNLARMHTYIC